MTPPSKRSRSWPSVKVTIAVPVAALAVAAGVWNWDGRRPDQLTLEEALEIMGDPQDPSVPRHEFRSAMARAAVLVRRTIRKIKAAEGEHNGDARHHLQAFRQELDR